MTIEVSEIDVDSIDVRGRLRSVYAAKVAIIAGSMADENNGQLTPIKVRKAGDRYQLVTGAHRLAACKTLGWLVIQAEIFVGSLEDALLAEIDENLCRADLNAADRAIFLRRRLDLYEVDVKKLRRGRGLGNSANMAALPADQDRFYKIARDQFGLSERTARRSLARGRYIPSEIFARLAVQDRDDGALLDKHASSTRKRRQRIYVDD
jgi:ParB family chromosome partitioning protein